MITPDSKIAEAVGACAAMLSCMPPSRWIIQDAMAREAKRVRASEIKRLQALEDSRARPQQ